MIPMRDGVRLYTVLIIPKGVAKAPIMLDRTPYSAKDSTATADSSARCPRTSCRRPYAELVRAGYIVAVEDVRGKFKSEANM